ncbi:RIP metalloprotease RseP [Methylonatrum kenyense]|uniref:RIP metalloprotease RseP n=1 Tax=Methylonatrum kenyense TaxID=455253 RepID=UPI0020BEB812|nr:RIP metalloprotease RseP [Methylonatrum kenyense]MCK8516379.1 RIP metalloprotease RseP [Methylonatrum kenyense]
MSGFGVSLLAFLVAIAILVAFHEFGHYWVARRLGVKVLRYSIGFGKPLYTRIAGPDRTEYCISAIPLGGYVKMLDEREGPVPEGERHRAFNRQSLRVRTAIVIAGPAFNFLFALAVYWLIAVVGTTEIRPMVGEVIPDTAADRAGLESGDEFVAVAGRDTYSWQQVLMALLDRGVRGSGEVDVTVVGEDGRERQLSLQLDRRALLGEDPDMLRLIGFEPWQPRLESRVGQLIDGGAAEEAGLRGGDLILAVDGASVAEWTALVAVLREHAGETVMLSAERDGARIEREVRLHGADSQRGVLGIRPDVPEGLYEDMQQTVRYGPIASVGEAGRDTWQASVLTVQVLWRMVTGEASLRNLSGPINIAQYAGDTASSGVVPFLKFLAIVSISLGIINLLPIPILDGGHLMYFLVEAVRGRPPSERALLIGQQVGIVLLLMIMSLAFYNDLARLTG